MTILPAPLPTLSSLIRATLSQPSSGNTWSGKENYISYYSRARWGLADAVRVFLSIRGNGEIYCPEYFCEEAMGPLRKIPAQIRFYPVQEDLQPDWDRLMSMRNKGSGKAILIIVHYFGFPNNVDKAGEFCRKTGIGLIEDAAHVLSPGPGGIGSAGGMVVYSPRKLLSVPDVGILVIRGQGNIPDNFIAPVNLQKGVGKWILKRLILSLMWHLGISMPQSSRSMSAASNDITKGDEDGNERLGCNPYSRKLLGLSERYLGNVVSIRRKNYQWLLNGIHDLKDIKPLFPSLPEGVCPYLFPLRIYKDRDRLLDKLRSRGIPAGTWPTLPPEVLKDTSLSIARRLRQEIITLPIHQTIYEPQMDTIISALHEVI